MVAEVVAILALILAHGSDGLRPPLTVIGQAALWVVVVTALMSAFDYFRRFNLVLNPRVAILRPRASSGESATVGGR